MDAQNSWSRSERTHAKELSQQQQQQQESRLVTNNEHIMSSHHVISQWQSKGVVAGNATEQECCMQLHHQLRRHQQGSPGTWLVESGHCLGHHFPLGFRQMHSQMIHKGAFSEPPNSQAVASQVLSLLHFPPETDTQARATLCTAWLPHWLLSLFHLPPTTLRHMP